MPRRHSFATQKHSGESDTEAHRLKDDMISDETTALGARGRISFKFSIEFADEVYLRNLSHAAL
jgi:hypothetical protein